MATTAVVEVQIDEAIKSEAEKVLSNEGLTISDFVRIVLYKVAKEKKFPFGAEVPNELTAQTLAKSVRNEDVHQAKDAEDLFKKLGI